MFLDHSWDKAAHEGFPKHCAGIVEGEGMGAVPGGTSELSQGAVVLGDCEANGLVLFVHICRLCCF